MEILLKLVLKMLFDTLIDGDVEDDVVQLRWMHWEVMNLAASIDETFFFFFVLLGHTADLFDHRLI